MATLQATRSARGAVWGPAALAALSQIGYPLVSGSTRAWLIVVVVVFFSAASLAHAVVSLGAPGALALLLVAAVGLLAEITGLRTGFPFGHYRYVTAVGPRVSGVPVTVPLAWAMMAWPSALAARRLVRSTGARVLVGAWALASWDLFLDPQLTAAGTWRWTRSGAHLPGAPTLPLANIAGWITVSLLISAIVQAFLAARRITDDTQPIALYLWTYASSVLALAAFLDLRVAAAWGALGMGAVAVPLALRCLR